MEGEGGEGMSVPSVTLQSVVPFMEKKKCGGEVFYFACVEFEGLCGIQAETSAGQLLCESEGWGGSLGQLQTQTR